MPYEFQYHLKECAGLESSAEEVQSKLEVAGGIKRSDFPDTLRALIAALETYGPLAARAVEMSEAMEVLKGNAGRSSRAEYDKRYLAVQSIKHALVPSRKQRYGGFVGGKIAAMEGHGDAGKNSQEALWVALNVETDPDGDAMAMLAVLTKVSAPVAALQEILKKHKGVLDAGIRDLATEHKKKRTA